VVTYDYRLICADVNEMAPWQQRALCTVCLAKVAPIVKALGLRDTWPPVERSLAFAWASITQPPRVEEGVELLRTIEETPEWNCNDSDYLPHVVAQALSFVEFALKAAGSISPAEQARKAMGLLLDFADPFDSVATRHPEDSAVKRLGMRIVPTEELSQIRIMGTIRTVDQPSRQVITELQREARTVSKMFQELLPIYCYDYVQRAVRLHQQAEG
jgi:hypothetical protein